MVYTSDVDLMGLSIIPLLFIAQYKYVAMHDDVPSLHPSARTRRLPLFLILPMRTRSYWTTGTMMRDITVSKRQLATNLASAAWARWGLGVRVQIGL